MNTKLRFFITFFTVIFTFFTAKASHLLGSEITFVCNGPGSYTVTLNLYRDCNGITPSGTQTLTYSSASCNSSGNIVLNRVGNPIDITPLCPGEQSACGGNGQWGVQKYTYTGTLSLPPGCGNDWVLGWSQCCRNGAINTLSSPSNQNMFVGALLNNTVTVPACNNSPVFNNPPASIVCVNQPVVYNHGVADVDGDSLYFSLGNCYEGYNNQVNYSGGYNGTTPLSSSTPITVNPNTGAISFTPNQQQVGVLCITVREYRNGVLVSEINRDMQFTVINCNNQPPQATGVDGSPNNDPVNFETSVCANGDLCFTIDGTDPNGNNVTMSWNNEIIGATFTVSNNGTSSPSAVFCWNPGQQHIGQNVFSVNVQDDACPIIGSGTYTYIIDVTPSPNTLDAGQDVQICFGETTTLTATSNPAATSYTWSPAATLSSSTGASVQASPFTSTTYEVRATFPDGCDITDVVTVGIAPNPNVSITPQNSFNCSGQPTDLSATNSSNYTYNWSPGVHPNSPNITVNATATTTYTVEVTESNYGCTATASATVTVAAPSNNVCNVLYVSTTGLSTNDGTKASPLDLETAMEVGACNGTTIKMAIGDYTTDSTINKVTSYLTLEGGFDEGTPNWDKLSTAGATRILRTATRSTSTASSSIIQGSGIPNEFGPNPEVVAIEVSNQTGFRFQDITIRSQLTNPNVEFQGEPGVDVIGVRLNSCNQYNLVRTQINTSQAGKGGNQMWSIPARNGGDARGLVALSNGAGTNLIQCNITAGAAGAGGNLNANGSPSPLAGTPGTTQAIQQTGTAFVSNQNSFNLAGQPIISMDDIACTATNMYFRQAASGSWSFGAGSSPSTATGTNVSTMYSSLGRKNIGYAGNNYSGFANILLDSQVLPAFTTSAPIVNGHYRICAGEEVNFVATNGGTGYIYHWDLGGGSTPNNYDGVAYETLQDIEFPTPGIYIIELRFETSCCGLSSPTTLELHVEERPMPTLPPDQLLCYGDTGVNLSVGGMLQNGTINWSPSTGLNANDVPNVFSSPGDTVTYTVILTDSTSLCSNGGYVTVNVVNVELTTSTTDFICLDDGTATVNVTGGSGNYSYQWDDNPANQITSTAIGLNVGTYHVMVTDNITGCVDSAVAVVNPAPTSLVGYISNTENVSCRGANDGSLTVSVNGGASPFDYSWTPAGGSVTNSASTSHTTSLLPGGIYTVTITDNLGCEYTVEGFIAEPDSLMSEIDSIVNPSCVGVADGYLRVFIDGGSAPHTFLWNDPSGSTTREISNLDAGTYCVTTTDANGCIDSVCYTITSPLLTDTVYDTICQNESYTFPDNDIVTNIVSDTTAVDTLTTTLGCDSIVTTFLTINLLPNVAANSNVSVICPNDSLFLYGTGADTYVWSNGLPDSAYFTPPVGNTDYYVTGTDINGCINYDTVTVTVNSFPTVIATATPNDTVCEGEQVTLTGSGAQAPYTWTGGITDGTPFVQAVGTTQYIVTASDANGCTDTDTISITVNPLPNVVANASDVAICEGDSIYLYGTGASSYVWDNGFQDSAYFIPPAGNNNYYVTGTDANGCVNRDTVTVVVTPAPNVIANTTGNNLCTPATITLTGSGANTYTWIPASVQNGVAFNPPIGSTDYIVIGTETATGCTGRDTITIIIHPLPTITATASPNDTLCQGEQLTLTGGGAQAPYTWTGGGGGVTDGTAFAPPVGTTVYTVTATDTNGCTNNTTITIVVHPNPIVGINVTPNDSLCGGEQVTLSGTGAQTYDWTPNTVSNGVSFTVNQGSTVYTVTGTDANGCTGTATQTIYGYLNYEFFDTVTICEDETHTLQNGTVVNTEGTYTVNFPTTANGCDSVYNTTVYVNQLLQYTPLEDIRVCSGLGVTLGVGAQNATSIQWYVNENGVEQSLAGNPNYVNTTSDSLGFNLDVALHENIYIIEMTDECGRVTRDEMLLEVFAPHAVANGVEDTTFCMHEISVITVDYNGHSYEWNNGAIGASILPTTAGDYIVNFVENYTNCLLSDTINIGLEDCIGNCVVLAPTGFSPNASGANDIFRVVTSCEEGFDYFEMTIYNRWGELVYYTDNWREGWDGNYKGRPAEISTYTYYVEYTKSISQEKGSIKGNVTLIR